jgi:hypothetical protein
MTMAILVSAVAVIMGSSVISDTEEKSHIFNAQAMGNAALHTIIDENSGPNLGSIKTLTLQDLYDKDRLAELQDPSEDGDTEYDPVNSIVTVENPIPSGNARVINHIYVKLVRLSDGYIYTDEADDGFDGGAVEAEDLKRSHINIPRRDASH